LETAAKELSVPGTGVPAYPPTYYPPAPVATWRLGITGTDWPGVGVRISTIEPEGPAEQMGIEVSDTIVQINGRPIRNMYDLRAAVAASGGYVRILVLDNRTNSYMWHNGSLVSAATAAPPA
jgi:S1-C subfamily serine protease